MDIAYVYDNDMNDKEGLDLMGTFAPIKPEGKNSFPSSSAQKALSILDTNDKEGLNSMVVFPTIAQEDKNSYLSSSVQKWMSLMFILIGTMMRS